MNWSQEMLPGVCALLVGAVLTFGAERLTHKQKDVITVKMIGVVIAVVGAVMIFIP